MISPDKSAASFPPQPIPPAKPQIIIPVRHDRNYEEAISKEPKTKIKHVLIAQSPPEGTKSPYFDLASKYKVKLDFVPFITVEGVVGRDFRKQRIVLNDHSGVIFTSRNAIDHFYRICDELRVKMSQETKFFCTSEAIALYLQKYTQYRKRKVFFGDLNNNKELRMLLMKHHDTTRFLYVCSEPGKDEIPAFLKANGFNYVEGVMYRPVPNNLKEMVELEKYDMLILFSPTGIHSLYHNYPKFKQNNLRIGVYGKTTADTVLDKGLKLHLMAPLHHNATMVMALDHYLKDANK